MTDYKNLKLIASSSPHIRSNEDTRSIMLDVIIALLPALAWSVYCFGWKALLLTAVSVVSCVFFEWAYRKLMKKSCAPLTCPGGPSSSAHSSPSLWSSSSTAASAATS